MFSCLESSDSDTETKQTKSSKTSQIKQIKMTKKKDISISTDESDVDENVEILEMQSKRNSKKEQRLQSDKTKIINKKDKKGKKNMADIDESDYFDKNNKHKHNDDNKSKKYSLESKETHDVLENIPKIKISKDESDKINIKIPDVKQNEKVVITPTENNEIDQFIKIKKKKDKSKPVKLNDMNVLSNMGKQPPQLESQQSKQIEINHVKLTKEKTVVKKAGMTSEEIEDIVNQISSKPNKSEKKEVVSTTHNKTENSKKVREQKDDKKKKQNNDEQKNLTTLFADKVEIQMMGRKLINESQIVINSNTKYLLAGDNGCGKSTLMDYLFNKLKDSHDILKIEQDVKIGSHEQTIRDFILCAHLDLYQNHLRMEELESLEELSDEQNAEYEMLGKYVCSHGWDAYEAKSNKILNGLGFKDPEKRVALLSGGWRMRLSLGRALLYEPSILFLDEPTNGLDINAVIWLEDYLSQYDKTIVMITHDTLFSDSIVNVTWQIKNPDGLGVKLYTSKGGYINSQRFLEDIRKEAEKKYEKMERRVVEMRKKGIPKKEVDEFIVKENAPKPPRENKVTIKFEDIDNKIGMRNVIELRNVSFGYSADNILLSNLDFSVSLKSRYVIVGENGMGKTTLFKLCTEQVKATNGDIIKDDRVNIAHYHQLLVDHLPLEMTPIEYLQSLDSHLSEDMCRAKLGRIGLKKIESLDIPKNKIGNLSGGQRVRVALCAIQLSSPSIILLDEVTNDMDVSSIEAIIEGINEFNGGIILITHNTHLIESIENYELFEVRDGSVFKFNGDFDEYKDKILKI